VVLVDKDGKFQLFSAMITKYIRVVVTTASLPGSNQSDDLAIVKLPGPELALVLATHWVARYRDPQAELTFNLDIADAIHAGKFIRVSDIIKMTSTRIVTKGKPKWDREVVFLTSVRPDFQRKRVQMTGMQTAFKKRYGFIGPSSLTVDYDAATEAQKEYAFIGDGNNQVGSKNEDGYYVW